MIKRILITIIAMIMIMSVCACTKSETPAATELVTTEKSTPTKEPDAAPTPSTTEEPEPEETELHIDKEFISNFLEDGQILFMETTEDMNENGGSEFGEISKKQMGKDGYEFTFKPNINEHLPLTTHLDEFEGATTLSSQAVFLRFNTTTTSIYFSFLGDNDFGVYFGDKGQPLVFTYTENNPFSFEGDLMLEAGKWHNMLMAMDKDGVFNCIIYLDDDSINPTIAHVVLGETASGEGYKKQSWQFEIATHEEGAVTVEHYDVYSYSTFIDE